jgi:hypothetical protein
VVQSLAYYPTVRLDYQILERHRATYAMNYQYSRGGPTRRTTATRSFPASPSGRSNLRSQVLEHLGAIDCRQEHRERGTLGYGGAPIDFSFKDFVPSP